MKIILTLSHGQASAERSFSVKDTVINVNMSEDSIVAKKIIKYCMISNELTPESVQITNKVLCSVDTVWQKFGDQLAENKKTKNQECIENQKNIIGWNKRSYGKTEDMQIIRRRICSISNPAQKEINISHVIKANTLKRRCVEIESEVTKLDETVLLLEEKKRKLE